MKAALHLCAASPEWLGRVTGLGTVAAPWEEGTGTNYAKVAGAACFELPGTSPDITAVILGQGGSLWRFADATPADAEAAPGRPSRSIRKQSRARLDGRSHGFCVSDDVGNEWSRDGDKFTWRLFRTVTSTAAIKMPASLRGSRSRLPTDPTPPARRVAAPSAPRDAVAPVTLPKSPEPKSTSVPHVTESRSAPARPGFGATRRSGA